MTSALAALRRSLSRNRDTPVPGSPAQDPDVVPAPTLRTEFIRRYFTGLAVLRTELAKRYIRGSGIEFGALDFPLAVPPGTTVIDADFRPAAEISKLFSVTDDVTSADIVTDLESMQGIASQSQDFVIANHVLEHVEDPLEALHSLSRVLRPHGIAYLAIPDKRFTFDKGRETTSLAHLLRDHAEGPDWSLPGHYEEWVRVVDGLTGDAHADKVATMLSDRANIHFHAWDFPAMMEMFTHVEREPGFDLIVENATLNPIEVIWILRKK